MASPDYEAEQARLRQQEGLEEDEEDFQTFQVPEVNPEVYKDVEPLLFNGFLPLAVSINGVNFVFKSLNHHEFYQLGLMNNLRGGPVAIQRYYNMFLAYGVAMVDEVNILSNRQSQIPDLIDFFGSLHKDAKQGVVRYLSEVNRRASRAVILTEAYAMEPKSRMRWAQVKGLDMSSPSVTGFPGTESLGLNWGQLLWRAFNHFEDLRDLAEREWENVKFLASATAGKGIQKVYNSDKRRREGEKKEQVERRERVIRHALLGTPLDDTEKHGPIKVARTAGELFDQVEKGLRGEKDWHDLVIAEHERKLRESRAQRLEKVRQLQEEHERKYGDRSIVALPPQMGLTQKDLEARALERQQRQAERLANQPQFQEFLDPRYEEFSKKWLSSQPIVNPPPIVMGPSDRPRSKPFGGSR